MNDKIKRYSKKGCSIVLGIILIIQIYITIRIYWIASCVIPTPSMSPTLIKGDYIIANLQIPGRRILEEKGDSAEGLNAHRQKGIRPIRKNDVVVFNFPYAEREDKMVLSMKLFYCKRCVAVPGDSYSFYKNGVPDTWYIPGRGDTVVLTPANYIHYSKCIEYETDKPVVLKNDSVYWGDSPLKQYCFQRNYYFMCGDNTEDSYDSRYWGLLPEDFILGVGRFIWFSKDQSNGKIRWERIFTKL